MTNSSASVLAMGCGYQWCILQAGRGLRVALRAAPACSRHRTMPAGRRMLALCVITGRTHGKEPGAAPGRAGDGACDRRQARIGRPHPVEAIVDDGDGVALAVVVANQ